MKYKYEGAIYDLLASPLKGEKWIKEVVTSLSSLIPSEYVLVGKLNDDLHTVTTIGFACNGEIQDTFKYFLQHTPCEIVLKEDMDYKMYPTDIKKFYPKDKYIDLFSLDNYYGFPLQGLNGQMKGLYACFGSQTHSTEELESIEKAILHLRPRLESELESYLNFTNNQFDSNINSIGDRLVEVMHEIRNPLMIIKSSINTIERKLGKGKEINSESLLKNNLIQNKAIQNIEQIAESVKSNIYFGKNNFKEISVNEFMSTVGFESLATNLNVDVELVLLENDFSLTTEPAKLEQVLLNIIVNAFHALEETENAKLKVELVNKNSLLEIHIIDNGPGIPENVKEQIFDQFFTTKEKKGTGVGLSISRKIMRQIGGFVHLQPSEQGAHFLITLNCTAELKKSA